MTIAWVITVIVAGGLALALVAIEHENYKDIERIRKRLDELERGK